MRDRKREPVTRAQSQSVQQMGSASDSRAPIAGSPSSYSEQPLLRLQRRYGNRYVRQMLASRVGGGAPMAPLMIQRDEEGGALESLWSDVVDLAAPVIEPLRRWRRQKLSRQFAAKYLGLEEKSITVSDKVQDYNFRAHNVSFLLHVRAALAQLLEEGLEAIAAERTEGAPVGTEAGDAENRAGVVFSEVEGTTDLKAAVVDAEFYKLVYAYQQVREIDEKKAKIGRATYDQLIVDFPDEELAYAEPYVEVAESEVPQGLDLLIPSTEKERYDLLKEVILSQYGLFFDEPYFINILGLRGVQTDEEGEHFEAVGNLVGRGHWNDSVIVLFRDETGEKHVYVFEGTTDPEIKKSGDPTTNFMAEGTHMYRLDEHKSPYRTAGGYPALIPMNKNQPGHRYIGEAGEESFVEYLGVESGAPYADNIHTTHDKDMGATTTEKTKNIDAVAPIRVRMQYGRLKYEDTQTGTSFEKLELGALPAFWEDVSAALSKAQNGELAFTIVRSSNVQDANSVDMLGKTFSEASFDYEFKEGKKDRLKGSGERLLLPDGVTDITNPVTINAVDVLGDFSVYRQVEFKIPGGPMVYTQGALVPSADIEGLRSEGCTVIKGVDKWTDFFSLVEQAQVNGQQVFPYTLMNALALQEELRALSLVHDAEQLLREATRDQPHWRPGQRHTREEEPILL